MTVPLSLIQQIDRQSSQAFGPGVAALRDTLLERYGNAVQAILYYGSCLRSGDDFDGLVDLYIIVDDYRTAYRSWGLSFFNALLPPNVFYLEVSVGDRKARTKYAVVALGDLQRGTSMRWFHSYLWGRFAQPTGIVYARDDTLSHQIHTALAQAVVTFMTRVLPQLPESFEATDLWRRGLSLSYQAELRTEKPERVNQLVETFWQEYESLTRCAMPAVPYEVEMNSGNPTTRYSVRIPSRQRYYNRVTWGLRRVQGKLLSVLRLMKAAFTFQGGVDYIVWKLERHSGVKIEVTPRLRRYPLLLIWGHFWRLYRRGVFR